MKQSAGAPSQSVAEDPQRAQVDADALIADHSRVLTEDGADLVDGEHMPDRARAQSWVGEGAHPAERNGLGEREPGGIDDRADQGRDPVGLQLGDGGYGAG